MDIATDGRHMLAMTVPHNCLIWVENGQVIARLDYYGVVLPFVELPPKPQLSGDGLLLTFHQGQQINVLGMADGKAIATKLQEYEFYDYCIE